MTAEAANSEYTIPQAQNIISVLWPSFLTGSLATILFFAFFDPVDLAMMYGFEDISRIAGYSIGFFAFWALSFASSTLTCYFRKPCKSCN